MAQPSITTAKNQGAIQVTDFNTMNEHIEELLEERAELYDRIHRLENQVAVQSEMLSYHKHCAEMMRHLESEREYWAGLVQRNS